ncbi:hypothetical protein BV22DRAFT_891697 [Leucogyrophana mollusca]|uniref:Uncharacterized protein n=1 Tax=Leucogyrophana mollusca TaxID=85980 RepID=A0ACB8B040_9AGAM|nr:hypothetical protein BV22DRAFT_891697 [Leucogyrophana mollusca]
MQSVTLENRSRWKASAVVQRAGNWRISKHSVSRARLMTVMTLIPWSRASVCVGSSNDSSVEGKPSLSLLMALGRRFLMRYFVLRRIFGG